MASPCPTRLVLVPRPVAGEPRRSGVRRYSLARIERLARFERVADAAPVPPSAGGPARPPA